jgi:NhaP-type Na+/H+ or K+/H+ antiporter
MANDILVVALAVLAFGLLAGRLRGSSLTMPMVFTAAGLLLGPQLAGVLRLEVDSEFVSAMAEAALVVVLFTDASRMDLRSVVRDHSLALRLLAFGLPLAIVIGTGIGLLLLPTLPVAAVALLAATLAPTDAALGQAFVADDSVPLRIRQTLNVESGLNDGLAVPFITVLIDFARQQTESIPSYLALFAELIGIGIAAGIAVGWLGGNVLRWSAARSLTTDTTQRLAVLALAAIAYAGAELMHGNGFVAAFTAGLFIGTAARDLLPHTSSFAETEGQLLTLVTFLLFGTVVLGDILLAFDWRYVAYALASLLLVRPLAVSLSLIGAGLRAPSVGFLSWAGPRGLASIVYAVLIAGSAGVAGATEVFTVAGWTILLSIYLHGLSAAPLSARYGARIQRIASADETEHRDVSALPIRLPRRT